jgi:transposase
MGRLVGDRDRWFYAFDLDAVVPADHLVRRIDGVLDLSWLHSELAPFYSHTGRPSIDPELMIRMLIVGYVFAIGSERQRCAEVQVNLAYRWFCGLPIEDDIPDHSVFSGARHEGFREGDILRRVFEPVVGTCIVEGLAGGEALSVDASLIEADVNPAKRLPGDEPIAWPARDKASRAVRGYLSALDRESAEAPAADGRASKPRMAVSLTDPQAAWVADRKIRSIFAYHANYPIDKSARNDGPFSPAEFHYDQPRNLYICPGGKALKTSGTAHDGTTYKYLAKRRDCQICPLIPSCADKDP